MAFVEYGKQDCKRGSSDGTRGAPPQQLIPSAKSNVSRYRLTPPRPPAVVDPHASSPQTQRLAPSRTNKRQLHKAFPDKIGVGFGCYPASSIRRTLSLYATDYRHWAYLSMFWETRVDPNHECIASEAQAQALAFSSCSRMRHAAAFRAPAD